MLQNQSFYTTLLNFHRKVNGRPSLDFGILNRPPRNKIYIVHYRFKLGISGNVMELDPKVDTTWTRIISIVFSCSLSAQRDPWYCFPQRHCCYFSCSCCYYVCHFQIRPVNNSPAFPLSTCPRWDSAKSGVFRDFPWETASLCRDYRRSVS